jgi:hypothetical protein
MPTPPFSNRVLPPSAQTMAEEVSPDDLRAILQALGDKAKAGDLAAAKLLLAYLFGMPKSPFVAGDRQQTVSNGKRQTARTRKAAGEGSRQQTVSNGKKEPGSQPARRFGSRHQTVDNGGKGPE